ncbi:MAG: hydroxylamine reductase, partial [Desulfobulbus sp.]
MFCNQCEQTAKGIGCTVVGVCGKNEEVADLHDLLIYSLQGLSLYALVGRKLSIIDEATDLFILEAIFSTLTNVDFDPERFVALINRYIELREAMKAKVAAAGGKVDFKEAPASFIPTG